MSVQFGLDAGWHLDGWPVKLGHLLAMWPDRLTLVLRYMARRKCWRAWIEPRDGGGYQVMVPAPRGAVRCIGASWGGGDEMLGAVRIARLEIADARRREHAGRW